jgi:hypothetical protein
MLIFPYHVAGKSYSVAVTKTAQGCRLTARSFTEDFAINSAGRTLGAALEKLNEKLKEGTATYEHVD